MEENNTVLITTSGLGNRLGELTKYTNKSLVRLGKKPALTRIIESYNKNTEFVITIGYFGEHIKEYISLAHPDLNVKFVKVDKFQGTGSSLLYSMKCAEKWLRKPFTFHACDTIVNSEFVINNRNVCFYVTKKNAAQYRTHSKPHDQFDYNLRKIFEKGEKCNGTGNNSEHHVHIGVITIKDHQEFWKSATKLLKNNPTDTSLSDCHVVNDMIENGISFETQPVILSLDTGNTNALKNTTQIFENHDNFKLLAKPNENIFILNDEYVIKFFADESIVKDRVNRLNHLNGYGPTLVGQTKHFFKYKFIKGDLAADSYNIDDFKSALQDVRENIWKDGRKVKEKQFVDNLYSFYISKTFDRANKLYKELSYLKDNQNLVINGLKIDSLENLLSKVKDKIITNRRYVSKFHGDFVLDNLIIKDGKFKFIDWRQDFQGNIDYGDPYYDLAKLNHSFVMDHKMMHSHFSIKQLFHNNYEVSMNMKHSSSLKKEVFNEFLTTTKVDKNLIDIITSIIWINMSPLHIEDGLHEALYLFGIYNLQYQVNKL